MLENSCRKYYYIYLHKNMINNKVYIGQTSQIPELRWKNGKAYSTCTYFFHAIQKYGWGAFTHTILEDGFFTKEEVNDKEDNWINYYNSRDIKYGYNITPGGYKGISPKALEKSLEWMSQHPEFGLARVKVMHEWQKENQDEMLRLRRINAKKATESRKRKIECCETKKVYESASNAAKFVQKTSQSKICMCCQGLRKTSGGLHWRYIDNE